MVDVERLTFRWSDYPPVTAGLPGTGGVLRARPEDFVVEELPLYLPSGSGSHVYVRVRKRGLTTRDLVAALVRAGLSEREVGVAGLKDKHAVTEQWLSVPRSREEAIGALERLDGVELLERSRHRNKLGVGHLRGNRFTITVREVGADAGERAGAILAELARRGVPNYFGPQRFGRFGTNAVDGLKVLRGERVPGGHRLQRFFLSALQSLAFNRLLALRVERGLFETVVLGDWARKHDTGGTFEVQDESEAERAERLEISATLPLYGRKVRPSGGRAGELEAEAMAGLGLKWSDFGSRHGDRRLSRLPLGEAACEARGGTLRLAFTLPKGAYATSLLREVTKIEVDEPQGGEAE